MSQQIYELELCQLSRKVNQGRASIQEERELQERIQKLKGDKYNKDWDYFQKTQIIET